MAQKYTKGSEACLYTRDLQELFHPVVLSVPIVLWDLLPDNPAYSFIGFMDSTNLVNRLPPEEQSSNTTFSSGRSFQARRAAANRDINNNANESTHTLGRFGAEVADVQPIVPAAGNEETLLHSIRSLHPVRDEQSTKPTF